MTSDDQIMVTQKDDSPGTGKYILAWIIASLVTYFSTSFIGFTIAYYMEITEENLMSFLLLAMILEVGIWLVVWISVYNWFSTLRIELVIPWLWGLGAIGVIVGVLQTSALTTVPWHFLGATVFGVLSLVARVLVFERFFRSKGRLPEQEEDHEAAT